MFVQEGRNRQIRKMMEALGYDVVELHREEVRRCVWSAFVLALFVFLCFVLGCCCLGGGSEEPNRKEFNGVRCAEEMRRVGAAQVMGIDLSGLRMGEWKDLNKREMDTIRKAIEAPAAAWQGRASR